MVLVELKSKLFAVLQARKVYLEADPILRSEVSPQSIYEVQREDDNLANKMLICIKTHSLNLLKLRLPTRVHSILEIGVICSQFLTGTDLNFAPVERVLKNLLDTGLWY